MSPYINPWRWSRVSENGLESMGAQDMADLGFQLRLGSRGDIDHGIGCAAANKVPAPLEGIDGLLGPVVVPPGGVEDLPAFFQ